MELSLQSVSPRCFVSGREFADGDRVVSHLIRGATSESVAAAVAVERAAEEATSRDELTLSAEKIKIRPEKAAKIDVDSVGRFDVFEAEAVNFLAPGPVACRWVQIFKSRKAGQDSPERALKLSAESLFLALGDPANERTMENERLLQVLAMMLERKRVLRPKGLSADKQRMIYEHAKLKSLHEVATTELSPEFFLSIQTQLAGLVGGRGTGATDTKTI
ncbi:MAG: hypothetical protein EAZ36_04325 [Verrucomicrobia bacterium]|nr:MAG: hypothetical protein EAZ36_04325 [Verrucomicrobiota bacterium]